MDKIHSKVLLAILLTSLGMCLIIGFILNTVFVKSFAELGKTVHLENNKRIELLMEHELKTATASKFGDWAAWDDTFNYMHNHNTTYENSNLSAEAFPLLKVDFVTYWDPNEKLYSGFYKDPKQKGAYLNTLKKNHDLLFSQDKSLTITGYIQTPHGAAYVASMPIYTTDQKQGPYGRMIVGREIDDNLMQLLSHLTNMFIEYHFPNKVSARAKSKIPDDLEENEVLVEDAILESEIHVRDHSQKHILSVDIQEKRYIQQHAKHQIMMFYVVFLSVAILAAALMTVLIKLFIVERINRLNAQVQLVKNGEAQSIQPPSTNSNDEIAMLTKDVYEMVGKLHEDEEELIRSKLQAEALSEAKTAFLANMSHEIRTPLHSLMGSIDLIETTSLSAEQKQYLEISRLSGVNLMEILGDILDFSKIEAGRIELNHAPFMLEDLINEVTLLIKPQLDEKALTLRLENNDVCKAPIVGDKLRLKQVLINILTNAKKYTPQGFVGITVDTKTIDQTCHLKISISDSGLGIPQDKLETIFDRFMQVDGSTKKSYSGVGLGLSICKSLMAMMGGEIGVESQLNKGSTFWIKLALPIEQTNEQENEEERFISIHTVKPHQQDVFEQGAFCPLASGYQDFNLLVVDDQAMNRTIMKKYLEKLGCRFQLACSGQEAFDLHKEHGFDLILMDIQMPDMDGVQAMRLIRWQAKKNPIFVALTANNSSKDIQTYLDAGFDDFAGKPIGFQSISDLLLKWADKIETLQKINALAPDNDDEGLDDIQKLVKKAKQERDKNTKMA